RPRRARQPELAAAQPPRARRRRGGEPGPRGPPRARAGPVAACARAAAGAVAAGLGGRTAPRPGTPLAGRSLHARERARLPCNLAARRGFSSLAAALHQREDSRGAMARGDVRIAVTLACEE